jgi:hypothetical protein
VNQLIQSDLEKHLVWIQKEQQLFKSKIFRNFFMEEIKLFIQTKPTDAHYSRLKNILSKMNYSPLNFDVQGIVSKIDEGHIPVQPLERPFIEEMLIVYHMNKLQSYLANARDISWVRVKVRQLRSLFEGREIPLNHLMTLISLEKKPHYSESGKIINKLINNIYPNVVERLTELIMQKDLENKDLKLGSLRSLSFYISSRDIVLSGEVMNDLLDIVEEPISREEGELAKNILQKQLPLLKENTDVIRRISIAIINCRNEKLRMDLMCLFPLPNIDKSSEFLIDLLNRDMVDQVRFYFILIIIRNDQSQLKNYKEELSTIADRCEGEDKRRMQRTLDALNNPQMEESSLKMLPAIFLTTPDDKSCNLL